MNCGDFRYLIQRRFDVELSPSDDRSLLIHLETCDSCQKFYHQVQQVIIAAEELELSEDLLPQAPDQLFRKICENIPQEQGGIAAIVRSIFGYFNFFSKKNNTKKENQFSNEEPLLPRFKQISNRKQQISAEPDDSDTGEKFEEITPQSIPTWGKSTMVATEKENFNLDEESQPLPNFVAPTDQVITRSLGEKFGLSGANPPLNNKQGMLSLAESIKQKISEMSKTNPESQSIMDSPDLTGEVIDEWTVPHSPQWPKLSTEDTPEQWLSETPIKRAPNAWGSSTVPNWGDQIQSPVNSNLSNNPFIHQQESSAMAPLNNQIFSQPAEQITQPAQQSSSADYNALQNSRANKINWSTEAEQLETGKWEMVQLNNPLGPVATPSLNPAYPSLNPPNNSLGLLHQAPIQQNPIQQNPIQQNPIQQNPIQQNPIQQNLMPQAIIPQISDQIELPLQTPDLPVVQTPLPETPIQPSQKEASSLDFPLENFPQLFMTGETSAETGPSIQTEIKSANNQNAQIKNSSVSSSTEGPKIYPVMSKRAQANLSATNAQTNSAVTNPVVTPSPIQPDNGSALINNNNSLPISQPVANDHTSEILSQLSNSIPSLPSLSETSIPEIIDDSAPLFKLDDNAIDHIFSNNLGVHESAIPAKTIQSDSLINSIFLSEQTSNPISAATTPDNAVDSIKLPPEFSAAQTDIQSEFESNQFTTLNSVQPSANPSVTQVSSVNHEPGSLFSIDDNLIDRIFTDALGVPEHISKNVIGTPMNNKSEVIQEDKVKNQTLPTEPQIQPMNDLSPQPEQIISNLPPVKPPLPKNNMNSSFEQPISSGYSSGKQKIAGVGKLDNRDEVQSEPGSGRIASIGKFLLDNKDLEKIGKITASGLSDSKMRTLTVEANEELKNLLRQIDAQEGVTGTVIVGHDGLLIANTMSQDFDPESLGVWALGVYMGTAHVVEKLGDDNVRQIVTQTSAGYLIIANFGAGLLVTLTNPIILDKLLRLMRTITQLVAA